MSDNTVHRRLQIGIQRITTFSYSATEYCSNDTDPSPTIASDTNGDGVIDSNDRL